MYYRRVLLNKITYHLHNGLLLCTIDGLGEDHSVVEVVVGGCEDEVEDREQAYETGLMVSYFNGFIISWFNVLMV